MWLELAAGAVLIEEFIRHRSEGKPADEQRLEVPIVDEGSPVPLLFGETRIRRPVMAWNGPLFWSTVDGEETIQMNVFYVLAAGFENGTNMLRAMYFGEQKVEEPEAVKLASLTGDGGFETPATIQFDQSGPDNGIGLVEFLNGKSDQTLVNDGGSSTNYSGMRMLANLEDSQIPGYRGVLSALLFDTPNSFNHGTLPDLANWNFVASSLRMHPELIAYRHNVGRDANPVNAIYEILTARLRCLGLPTSMIDTTSFRDAQSKLYTETLGYSRCFDERMSAAEMIDDICKHIDAVVYGDPTGGLIKIKLIRPDYNPLNLFTITNENCTRLAGFALESRSNLVNKVTVRFPNRSKNYDMDTVSAQDMANAVGQDGQLIERVIDFLGCCEPAQAANFAARELAYSSAPVVKLQAQDCHGSALRLSPGEPVRVMWKNPDMNAVFRVVKVNRGTLEDGGIYLDLVKDVGSYVWRNQTPTFPWNPTPTLPSGGTF